MNHLKAKIPAFFIISFLLYSCQLDVPIKELTEAKTAITKAEKHSAETYAPEDLAKAKELVKKSHTSINEEKKQESIKYANEAKDAAKNAFDKSIKPLANDTIENAEKIISEAQKANAEEFAPEEYKNASEKIASSKMLYENNSFEESYNMADEAESLALEAKSESLKNKPALEEKSNSIMLQINQVKSNNGMEYAADEIKMVTQNLENANKALEGDNLIDTIKYIDEASLSLEKAKEKETEYLKIYSIKENINKAKETLDKANNALADETSPELYLEASNLIESAEKNYNDGKHEQARKESEDANKKSSEVLNIALENKPVFEKEINQIKTRYQLFEDKNAAEKSPEEMKKAKENIDSADNSFVQNNFRETRVYLTEAKNALDTAESTNPELMLISRINQAESEYNFLNSDENRKNHELKLNQINSQILLAKENYNNSENQKALSDIDVAITLIDELKITLTQGNINLDSNQPGTRSYTVKYNPKNRDCLWKISEKVYKRADLWPLIYAANRDKIKDPDLIFPGQNLIIPPVPEKDTNKNKQNSEKTENNAIVEKKEEEIITDENKNESNNTINENESNKESELNEENDSNDSEANII